MNKPDRFVDIFIKEQSRHHRALLSVEIIALLRRQHRAYVRMVKQQGSFGNVSDGGGDEWILRYNVLAAFTRYAKGKGTPCTTTTR